MKITCTRHCSGARLLLLLSAIIGPEYCYLCNPAFIFPQLCAPNHQRLRRLQDIQHACPRLAAGIPPRMVRAPLHGDISAFQEPRLPGVEKQLDLAFQHDAKIAGHSPVHRADEPGRVVDRAANSTAGDRDGGRVAQKRFIVLDILIPGHDDWEG